MSELLQPEVPMAALVTGANKGIGYAICARLLRTTKNVHVIMGSRSLQLGQQAAAKLRAECKADESRLSVLQLDVTDDGSVHAAAKSVSEKWGKQFRVLINNAGMAFKGNAFDEQVARGTIETNYYGTLRVCSAMLPLLGEGARVVNVSSRAGLISKLPAHLQQRFKDPKLTVQGLSELMNTFISQVGSGQWEQAGWPHSTYAVSKMGVTTLTHILARENTTSDLLINCVCPGWCKTDMAGDRAPLTADQGAVTPVMCALLPHGSLSGHFFWEEKPHPWDS